MGVVPFLFLLAPGDSRRSRTSRSTATCSDPFSTAPLNALASANRAHVAETDRGDPRTTRESIHWTEGEPRNERREVLSFCWAAVCASARRSIGCKDKPQATLAPTASALQADARSCQRNSIQRGFGVQQSHVLDGLAIGENRRRRVRRFVWGSVRGPQPIISKSTALVKVDLQKLVLYQQKRGDDKGSLWRAPARVICKTLTRATGCKSCRAMAM